MNLVTKTLAFTLATLAFSGNSIAAQSTIAPISVHAEIQNSLDNMMKDLYQPALAKHNAKQFLQQKASEQLAVLIASDTKSDKGDNPGESTE